MQRRIDFPFSLNADEPFSAVARYGDVLRRAENIPAVAVANPAELGEFDSTVRLINSKRPINRTKDAVGVHALYPRPELRRLRLKSLP